MKNIKLYRNFFELVDERTELKLFKKYVFELIDLAEEQEKTVQEFNQKDGYGSNGELPNLKGRGTSRLP